MSEQVATINGAIEEIKLILEAFQNKDSANRQIVTQPVTYFTDRLNALEARKQKLEAAS